MRLAHAKLMRMGIILWIGGAAVALAICMTVPRSRSFVLRKLREAAVGRADAGADEDKAAFDVKDGRIRVTGAQALAMGLEVGIAGAYQEPLKLTITGKTGLDPERVSHVHAQFPGRIVDLGPLLGTRVVGPGDPSGPSTVLCAIESADLATAKGTWLQAKAQVDQDADQLRRAGQLTKDEVVSEKALLDAQISLRKSRAALEQARQQLLIFGLTDADLPQIESQQGRERMVYRVMAPRSGVIIEKNVTRGELADQTQNLFTIADLSSLWVWGDVYERDWDRVRLGQEFTVDVSARPGQQRRTKVEWISPVLDPSTRSIKIRGTLDNRDGRLLADLFATIELNIEVGAASVIPASALVTDAKGAHVLVGGGPQGDSEFFESRSVEAENIDRQRVRVRAGVRPGERIVQRGALALLTELEESERESQRNATER
jgi:cobalt-zinc-cadmium efflux system membrane fusion protein